MDILSELETAAKWAKINSYVYLFSIIVTVLSVISGFFMLSSLSGGGDAEAADVAKFMKTFGSISIAANVFWIVFYWICRNVFSRYEQSLRNATQSLSSKEIEEVCHYQRNVFITYGAYYLIFIVMIALVIGFVILMLAGAMGSVSGAVD